MSGSDFSQLSDLPVMAFRFHGLRKLNWVERFDDDYDAHLAANGFDRWLPLTPLTIIVGPNGGGKTTLIDLFRALGDASLWPRLSRENYGGGDFSGFDVSGGCFRLRARFSRHTKNADDMFDYLTLAAVAENARGAGHARVEAPKFGEKPGWDEDLQALLDDRVGLEVRSLAATGPHPADAIDDDRLIELLNELAPRFPSVMANPIVKPFASFGGMGDKAGRIGVLFKDDPDQHSFVHRSNLPLGWLQLAAVLDFVRACPPGSLILLDEPDRHLHPSLQRALLELIAVEREERGAQIILATHSSVLVNPELCERVGASVLVAARGRCELLTDARRVLDDLGVTSGDLVQANGVIWVEGPSDRIYIKRWLELYARAQRLPPPIERVHYAFVSYGGSLLKHVGLDNKAPDRIDLRTINRNFAVVIDRDLSELPDGRLAGDKGRLLVEAESLSAYQAIWITQDYTVESYLPADWLSGRRHLRTDSSGRLSVHGISKVELARRFADESMEWPMSFAKGSDLPSRIAILFDQIALWQSPQEVIAPSHYPPFL